MNRLLNIYFVTISLMLFGCNTVQNDESEFILGKVCQTNHATCTLVLQSSEPIIVDEAIAHVATLSGVINCSLQKTLANNTLLTVVFDFQKTSLANLISQVEKYKNCIVTIIDIPSNEVTAALSSNTDIQYNEQTDIDNNDNPGVLSLPNILDLFSSLF